MQGKNRKDTRERHEGYKGNTGRIQGKTERIQGIKQEGYKGKT